MNAPANKDIYTKKAQTVTLRFLLILKGELYTLQHQLLNVFHNALGNIGRHSLAAAFCINTNDRLCIGSTQVHPILIKFYFQSVFRVDGLATVFLLNGFQDALYIHAFAEVDLIFGNKIIGIAAAQRLDALAVFGEMG